MAKVTFKAKPRDMFYTDDTLAYRFVSVPKIGRQHCNMSEFRSHKRFGGFANSDMFPAMLARALKANGIGNMIKLSEPLPDCVTVDESGFLAIVTIEL